MVAFCVAFFKSDDLMLPLRNWQAMKFLDQSKGYQAIGKLKSTQGQDEDAIKTAEKAYLLAPANMTIARNLAKVYYKVDPIKGLDHWENIIKMPGATLGDRIHLVNLALKGATRPNERSQNQKIRLNSERKYFLEVARRQLALLSKDHRFRERREFQMTKAEYLAEVGNPETALAEIQKLRAKEDGKDPLIDLIFCRIAIRFNRPELVEEAKSLLRKLAEGDGQTAIEAIRHFSLVHLVRPLAQEEIVELQVLLEKNNPSVVDRLRLLSLELDVAKDSDERNRVISKCASIFDLSVDSDLVVYSNWLGKMGQMEVLLEVLPLSRASRSEDLFKIRLAALANLGRFEALEIELEQSNVLQAYWRYAFGARALSASRKFTEVKIKLNKLVDAIYDDNRKVIAVCKWFAESADEPSLCYILEKLSNDSRYEIFCAEGLLRHRGATAKLADIQKWISILALDKPVDLKLQNVRLYWALLSPNPTKAELKEWLNLSNQHLAHAPNDLQFRITAGLALLRNDLPIEALSILENAPGKAISRPPWKLTRPAWTKIYAVALARNQRTEESIDLANAVAKRSSSRAETIALSAIFPSGHKQ
tara:strand:- start:3674 stop:5449 length:1776 start_codon:yes stop_codon:yes gene_type:complete